MKRIYFLFILFFSAASMALGQVDVTFQVDMTREFILNGKGSKVSVAGSFQNWTPGATELTDPDGDSIYTVTVQINTGTYEYKFLNGDAWGTDESVPSACATNNNRSVTINGATTIPVVCFGTCVASCPAVAPAVNVTFRVDMNNEVVNSTDGVHVAGSYQNPAWVKNQDEMTDPDGDGVFEFTAQIRADEYQFKFINGDETSEEENFDFLTGGCGVSNGIGGWNRSLNLTGITSDTTLPIFVYNSCATTAVGIEDDLYASAPVRVYPNPFSSSTTLSFSNERGISYTVEVLSLSGQVIKRVENFRGNELEISSEGMAPGMYLLSIANQEGERYTRKLILK